METFGKLLGSLLLLLYHCFDRIVIQGYLPLLSRPEHIVHFFRDVHGIYPITQQALAKRTNEYKQWVEAFARNHHIPIEWPKKGVNKEDYVRPYYARMERRKRFGVYFIFRSLEQGRTFRSARPKYPTGDPNYRILRNTWPRFTHFYFYIRDEVLGPLVPASGPSCPSRPLTISTVIISSRAYSGDRESASARTLMPSWGCRTRKHYRPPPIASAPRSSAGA